MKVYRGMKKYVVGGIVMMAVVSVMMAGAFFLYAFDRAVGDTPTVVEVEKATSGRDIAELLQHKGVIRSATVFRAALFLTGDSRKLQCGHYYLKPHLSIREVISEMKSGKSEMVSVTVPEGATVQQIAEILKKSGLSGADGFVDLVRWYAPLPYIEEKNNVRYRGEGFLFADTYFIPKDYTTKDICDMMYMNTDKMLDNDIRTMAKEKGMSLYDLVTLASMVEREARFKEDQKPIASVMLTRLEKGMPLQIDATVQYALGGSKVELSLADTKINSPYNTYVRIGLPPGPVSSPGIDAIRAVLSAEPSDYLYYVARSDGHHIFTKTLEEHEQAIRDIYG